MGVLSRTNVFLVVGGRIIMSYAAYRLNASLREQKYSVDQAWKFSTHFECELQLRAW